MGDTIRRTSRIPPRDVAARLGLMLVEDIVDNNLCLSCGVCAGTCHIEGAIKMVMREDQGYWRPEKTSACVQCTMCERVCPAFDLDIPRLSSEFIGSESRIPMLGVVDGTYIGYAADPALRARGASGGLGTAILVAAMREKFIDGAVVVAGRSGGPYPEALIARSEEEIITAARSKYTPIHFGEVIQQIMTHPGRYALVGLPCHIEGIRKAQQYKPVLKERVVFTVSLFCGHVPSVRFTEFVARKNGIRPKEIRGVRYRQQGWWNYAMEIDHPAGTTVALWRNKWPELAFSRHWFTQRRCELCVDFAGELADISLGDAWLPDYANDENGWSIMITRGPVGNRVVSDLRARGYLTLESVSKDKVVLSQAGPLEGRDLAEYRAAVLGAIGAKLPKYLSGSNWRDKLDRKLLRSARFLFQQQLIFLLDRWGVLELIPYKVFFTGFHTLWQFPLKRLKKLWRLAVR